VFYEMPTRAAAAEVSALIAAHYDLH